MTQHQNNVGYFRRMAAAAKSVAHRIYWLGRAEGKEAADKQRAADAAARAKIAQRAANLNDFNTKSAPKITIDSKHPHGLIVRWEKPKDWEPDTYMVLVRDAPLNADDEWRSVASANITRETRKMVLTPSYLSWGAYKEPYYIRVAAVKEGVGRKESEILMYPPDPRVPVAASASTHYEVADKPKVKEIKLKPMQAGAGTFADPFKARHPGPAEEPMKRVAEKILEDVKKEREIPTRAETIAAALHEYAGRRTRSGRPYIGDFRKHLQLTPRVGYRELRNIYKRVKDDKK